MVDRWIALLDLQKYLQEKFWRYRNGDETHEKSRQEIRRDFQRRLRRDRWRRAPRHRANNMAGDHELAIRARKVPRVDYRRQSRDVKRILNEPVADLNKIFYTRPDGATPGSNLDWVQRDLATEEFHNIAELITARRNFTYIKVLGAGGNGIVVLWRWTPGSDAAQAAGYDVAMKYSILENDEGYVDWGGVNFEKRTMDNFVRAPHLAQRFYFRDKIPDPPGRVLRPNPAMDRANQTANNLDAAPNILALEFARMGDLRNWIEKLVGEDNHLPPEAIWRIFDCLVKGCVAMEYPPYRRTPGHRAGEPLEEVVPQGPPGAPPSRQFGHTGFVHFDMDPKNIFVLGYDQNRAANPLNPDHTQVPRFQIGDFGAGDNHNFCWRRTTPPGAVGRRIWDRRYTVWDQRTVAKNGWFLPEQFSSEWDQLDRGPDDGPPNVAPGTWPPWDRWRFPSGPGRYSSFSNIWHVGMTMFCLLLLQRPDFPPVAGRMFSAEPPQYDPVPVRHQRWTYGYRLIQDNEEGQEYRDRFTPLLCETIARCLMHKQEHRPDLVQLQRTITNALGNPPPRLPGNDVRRFFGGDAQRPIAWYYDIDLQRLNPFNPYGDLQYPFLDGPDSHPRPGRRRRGGVRFEDRAYRP